MKEMWLSFSQGVRWKGNRRVAVIDAGAASHLDDVEIGVRD